MILVRYGVPLALLCYFLYRARTARIFLLGIPFLMLMGPSVFFDRMKIFWVPGRFEPSVLIMVWLAIVWALSRGVLRGRRTRPAMTTSSRRARIAVLPEEAAVAALAALVLVHVVAGFISTVDLAGSAGAAATMLYMVVGYVLVRDIVAHSEREDVVSFLGALVAATTVAAVLFILHQGLHLGIYQGAERQTLTFAGQSITRTFWFAPPFILLLLSLAYGLAQPRWGVRWLVVLAIDVVAIWVTYTRTLLVAAIAALLLVMVLRELKRPRGGRILRRLVAIAAVALGLLWALAVVMPAQSQYFLSRLSTASSTSGVKSDPNLAYRFANLASTTTLVADYNLLFGAGFMVPSQSGPVAVVYTTGDDMAWILVVFELGVVGAAAFVILFVAYGLRAFQLFWRSSGLGEYLGLVYLVTLGLAFLVSLVSRVFMEPNSLPLGLWLFAFVAAEVLRGRSIAAEGEATLDLAA